MNHEDFLNNNYTDELNILDNLSKQKDFNTITCALCTRIVDLPKYINESHICNNNYCERCINTLHNKCFDCFMPISQFFNRCIYTEVKPNKYQEFNFINNNIKEKINKSIEEYNKGSEIELECDICCGKFFKDNDMDVCHTCTTIYCMKCSKLVNNNCGVCDKNIYIKKKNLFCYHFDIMNGTEDKIKLEELECDICYDTFTKNPNIIVNHPCSITYCENCTKLCSNFCKVCKNKISEKIIKHDTIAMDNPKINYDHNKNWNASGVRFDYCFINSSKYEPASLFNRSLGKAGNTIDWASFIFNNNINN